MATVPVASGLNEMQAKAVELVLTGIPVGEALAAAGYSEGYNANSWAASSAVQQALRIGRSGAIAGRLATKALMTMESLMESKADTVRYSAAKWFLEAAGHGQKGEGDGKNKPLHEMTEAELREVMAKAHQVVQSGGMPPIITITPDNGAE